MRLGLPPRGVAPERLFRRLLARHVSEPVDFRFGGVEHGRLTATTLLASEVAELEDRLGDGVVAGIVALSLRCDGEAVFSSPDEVLAMSAEEYAALRDAFMPAWFACSPIYGRCDLGAWREVLDKGAKHPTNARAVHAMGECFETVKRVKTIHFVDRPDRYFGGALCELTDGQLMCFAAARRLFEQRNPIT